MMMMDAGTVPEILCCVCGVLMQANATRMCVNCLKSRHDISEGIQKAVVIHNCRHCNRWYRNPTWVHCDLESADLLNLCLKKIKGLQKVKVADARFLWTEPHSRKLKVELSVQREVVGDVVLQQSFPVEFSVLNYQCDSCKRVQAKDTWQACVQVRQDVEHKRTIFFLEQLILRHHAHEQCTNIKEEQNGFDFFFGHRSHAQKFVEFLQKMVPCKSSKASKRLISADANNNTYNFKYTFMVEIVPVCKDDLICLPLPLAHQKGNISPLVVCYRVGKDLHMLDPCSLKTAEVNAMDFYKNEFRAVCNSRQLMEYIVLDVERITSEEKHVLANITVARVLDFGRNDNQFVVRSHLGALLKAGDTAQGYDVCTTNFNDDDLKYVRAGQLPDVVLVKKVFSQQGRRIWKLHSLEKEAADVPLRRNDEIRNNMDYEQFMQDLEQDREMRAAIHLYKDPEALAHQQQQQQLKAAMKQAKQQLMLQHVQATGQPLPAELDEEEEDRNEDAVGLEELLDEMTLNEGLELPEQEEEGVPPQS